MLVRTNGDGEPARVGVDWRLVVAAGALGLSVASWTVGFVMRAANEHAIVMHHVSEGDILIPIARSHFDDHTAHVTAEDRVQVIAVAVKLDELLRRVDRIERKIDR